MKKKTYISPNIHVINCSNETMLAGSDGLQVYENEVVDDSAPQYGKQHNFNFLESE